MVAVIATWLKHRGSRMTRREVGQARRTPLLLLSILAACLSLSGLPVLVSGNAFSCRDRSRCRTYSSCSKHEALLRSGHLCNGFPTYNGGPPILPFKWDDESKSYACLTRNGTVCTSWKTEDRSRGEIEVGFCKCNELGPEHCQAWSCVQDEANLCSGSSWDCGPVLVLADGTQITSSCCSYNGDGVEVSLGRELQKETMDCECKKTVSQIDLAASQGAKPAIEIDYCVEWHCTERDLTSLEDEDYVCLGIEKTFCKHWEGNTEGTEEFEVTSCVCASQNTTQEGRKVCDSWVCLERGFNYHDPNLGWIAFGVLLGLLAVVLMMGTLEDYETACWCIFPLVFWGAIMFITTFMGGVGALLITLAVNIPAMLLGVCVLVGSKKSGGKLVQKIKKDSIIIL